MSKMLLLAACAVALPSLAFAADLDTKAPAVVPLVAFAWTDKHAVRLLPLRDRFSLQCGEVSRVTDWEARPQT